MKKIDDLFFISGSMFGQKSKKIIDIIKIAEENKAKILVYKPTNDTRDGLFIKSRDYEEGYPALPWDINNPDRFNEFKNNLKKLHSFVKPKSLFFDEVHFLSLEDIKWIINICKAKKIVVFMSGLETTFKQENFPSTEWLKEVAGNYKFFYGDCNYCDGNLAVYNILYDKNGNIVKDGEDIQPGSEEYKVCCKKCFNTL